MEQTLLTSRNLSITSDYFNEGMTQRAIAAKYNLSQQRIFQVLQDDSKELQEFKDKSIKKQFVLLNKADKVVEGHLNDKNPMGKSLDAAKLVYKNTGITPSHTQINIGKLLQDNRTQIAEIDGIKEFIAWKLSSDNPANAIDVTPDSTGLEGETDSEGE